MSLASKFPTTIQETNSSIHNGRVEVQYESSSPTALPSSPESNYLYDSDETDESRSRVDVVVTPSHPTKNGLSSQMARAMAHRPCLYLWSALISTLLLSTIGLLWGDFTVTVNNTGWQSRGTLIANRHTQFILTYLNRFELSSSHNNDDNDDNIWQDLTQNVQDGWEDDSGGSSLRRRRRLETTTTRRSLEEDEFDTTNEASVLRGCDTTWYGEDMVQGSHLWPIWKVPSTTSTTSTNALLLDGPTLQDLCESEQETQDFLQKHDLCYTCGDNTNRCLPPFSIVFWVRMTVDNGLYSNCNTLAQDWEQHVMQNPQLITDIHQCATIMASGTYDPYENGVELPESCPRRFSPTLIDFDYAANNGTLMYTSSIFATRRSSRVRKFMYDHSDQLHKGTPRIQGAYDTQYEHFVNYEIDESLLRDMALATGSALITTAAIFLHTQSPFLALVGILQILLSFPLAYFVYTFVAGLSFFPFLNFIGIFVVFALGADDIFVAVDKWKNVRLEWPTATTEQVASVALPDAAQAMFLTTLTTAVAFFGTAVCPVAPILCFAVFCGLLIVMDYVLCVTLIFPALCIYDRVQQKQQVGQEEEQTRLSCWTRCCCFCFRSRGSPTTTTTTTRPEEAHNNDDDDDKMKDSLNASLSLIRTILSKYYDLLHTARYPLFVAVLVAFGLSTFFASQLKLPTTGDVRLLRESNEFEQNWAWRQKILFDKLVADQGSSTFVLWGTTPADTGNHNNPESFSQLVLDDSFAPSQSQEYLRDFCANMFAQEFAQPFAGEEDCPINRFDSWLNQQAALATESQDLVYQTYCNGARGLPMNANAFDACMSNWAHTNDETYVMSWDGQIKILMLRFNGRVRYDSPFDENEAEWKLIEDWFQNERETAAPPGASNMYFTSDDFWWYDTNQSMIRTAFVAAGIAIATGALVILFSSHSIVLTAFAAFTICYVLASVTAGLVALGWTLGFIEAICYSILIGISCDFVIHFTHSYASLPGSVDRHTRTKTALIKMGPSILAAAFTTISAAIIMLFTVITFFVKFAVILFMTIVQATLGSFIVFLVIADTLGPTQPTYLADHYLCPKSSSSSPQEQDDDEEDATPPSEASAHH